MAKILKYFMMFLFGGFTYYMIEILWRSFSHPSMYLAGGCCFLMLGFTNHFMPWKMPFWLQCVIGAVGITAVEFLFGVVVNILLGLNVWDYSGMPLNLFGQVSLLFCFLWIPLAALGIYLFDYLDWKLYGGEKPHYKFI